MKRKKSRSRDWGKLVSYTVSYDSIVELFGYSDEEIKVIDSLHGITLKKPRKALAKLLSAIEKHPKLPQLYNYLTVCYYGLEDEDNAVKTIMCTMELFPDYLFGKVSYAEHLITKGRYEEIPELFNNKFDVKILYPKRDIFHCSEVLSLYGVVAHYFYLTGDFEKSVRYFDAMEQIDADDYRTKEIGKRINAKV